MHFIRTIKAEKEYNLNGEIFTESDLINIVKEDLRIIIKENNLDVEIEDVELIGSYTRGENTSESDLDILVQYSGDLRDDDFFNIISEEQLELNGVKIDINPINSAKDGVKDFKERNKGFSKKQNDVITHADPYIIYFYYPYNNDLDLNDSQRWNLLDSSMPVIIEGDKTDTRSKEELKKIAIKKWHAKKNLQDYVKQHNKHTIYLWVALDPNDQNIREPNIQENIHGFIQYNKNM